MSIAESPTYSATATGIKGTAVRGKNALSAAADRSRSRSAAGGEGAGRKGSAEGAKPPTEPGGEAALGNPELKQKHAGDGQKTDYQQLIWSLQRTLWKITENPRFAGCHRWMAPGAGAALVVWQGKGRARWGALQDSHSVWCSPVSAAKIARLRAEETRRGVQAWLDEDKNHSALFLTCTVRHNRTQSLDTLWDAISSCWSAVIDTPAWRGGGRSGDGDRRRYGVRHYIKATEVTHGKHGWHVHLHVVLLTDRTLSDQESAGLRSRILGRWSNRAVRRGLDAPSEEHGIDLKQAETSDDARKIAGYVSKGGIAGLGNEIAGGVTKRAYGKGRTPFQILADLGAPGKKATPRDRALWQEWEKSSHGRRQITWSRGTKKELGIADLTDADLIDEENDDHDRAVVARVVASEWKNLMSDVETRLYITNVVAEQETAESAHRRAQRVLERYGITAGKMDGPVSLDEYQEEPEIRAQQKERTEFLAAIKQRDEFSQGMKRLARGNKPGQEPKEKFRAQQQERGKNIARAGEATYRRERLRAETHRVSASSKIS